MVQFLKHTHTKNIQFQFQYATIKIIIKIKSYTSLLRIKDTSSNMRKDLASLEKKKSLTQWWVWRLLYKKKESNYRTDQRNLITRQVSISPMKSYGVVVLHYMMSVYYNVCHAHECHKFMYTK